MTQLAKQFIQGVILMSFFFHNQVGAEPKSIAAIKTVVESIAVLADQGNFEALETLYADEILINYKSLNGVKPELKSPQKLMTEWAGVLPGFDRTRHQLTNVQVTLDEQNAIATADVVADHYVSDLFWQVSGSYHYELRQSGARWYITSTTFHLKDEQGTRDALSVAVAAAKLDPASYVKRQQTEQAVRSFLTALETKNMDLFASVWAEDAVQDMPYSPKGHPKRVVSKSDIVALYSGWPEVSGDANFTSELRFYPHQDPETVFVEFKGEVDVIPTGRTYRQTYGGLFHVVDGKIKLFREYFDPIPFAWDFGLSDNLG